MSESATTATAPNHMPIQVDYLDPASLSGLPEAPTSPGAPAAPLSPDEWTAMEAAMQRIQSGESTTASPEITLTDQALMLHDEIYGSQNGVPSVEAFRGARSFVEGIHYDANATTTDMWGNETRGAYYSADGEQLPGDIAEDLLSAANPEKWVHTGSHNDVLAHARDLLDSDVDFSSSAPTLELAEGLAARLVANPNAVHADDLQRIIDLDAEARRVLLKELKDPQRLAEAVERNSMDVAWTSRTPVDVGVNQAGPKLHQQGDVEQERVIRPEDMLYEQGRNNGRATVRTRYAEGTPDGTDTQILQDLIGRGEIMTAADVAAYLYPTKVVGGSSQYGATRWRGQNGVLQMGETAPRDYHAVLDPAELAEVEGFAQQLATARRLEGEVPQDFRDHIPMPNHQEVAEELFPGVEKLTPAHWAVVRTAVARLRAIRVEQTHVDRLQPLRMRWARIKQVAGDAWSATQSAATAAKGKFDEARAAAPGFLSEKFQQAQGMGENAREVARPENLKALFGMAVGAVAVHGARIAEEKPWQQILPSIRERLIPAVRDRVIPQMREFVMDIVAARPDRVLAVRIQLLAQDAGRRLSGYLQQRLGAAREMDRGERNYRLAATAAVVALASTLAIRAYLQTRHNIHLGGTTGGHDTVSNMGIDVDTSHAGGNTSHGTGVEVGTGHLDAAAPDHNAHTAVEVGSFDSSQKIMGYPKGTVGFRVLEQAQANGFKVTNQTQADRLIDATLKMDHLGWNTKVGDHQQVSMLSFNQIQDILNKK
jgi:hypothetical protein